MKDKSIDELKTIIAGLESRDKRLTAELDEYVKAEEVLIAAGIVDENKIQQAHEIVQNLS